MGRSLSLSPLLGHAVTWLTAHLLVGIWVVSTCSHYGESHMNTQGQSSVWTGALASLAEHWEWSCWVTYKNAFRGAWVAELVERLTSAPVMISRVVGSSPASGSVLTARSLEPVSDSVSPSLSASPPFARSLSLSLSLSQK